MPFRVAHYVRYFFQGLPSDVEQAQGGLKSFLRHFFYYPYSKQKLDCHLWTQKQDKPLCSFTHNNLRAL